ncbi:hypothetical protein VTK73DRAFT_10208 [Phialemonium thermophilum]|uniref:Ankyrin repeat protein n=1 Tax=Phialemonium thermophilum TaxID=223376 RepID=A0ABR3VXZ2_9PEZI
MPRRVVDLYLEQREKEDVPAFVSSTDIHLWTPLHWACRDSYWAGRHSYLDTVAYLIDKALTVWQRRRTSGPRGMWPPGPSRDNTQELIRTRRC